MCGIEQLLVIFAGSFLLGYGIGIDHGSKKED